MNTAKFKIKDALNALEKDKTKNSLSLREKHLVGLAVTLTRGCQDCTSHRISEALKIGIEYETIEKTVELTAAVNAGVVLKIAVASANSTKNEKPTDDDCDVGLK
jgi:alkylhydroperoxidase/carboxymuconolactone decarboxylase family protein YurZ